MRSSVEAWGLKRGATFIDEEREEMRSEARAMGSSAPQSSASTDSPGDTAQIGRERHSGRVERAAIETARRLARRLERREGAPRGPAWGRQAVRCPGGRRRSTQLAPRHAALPGLSGQIMFIIRRVAQGGVSGRSLLWPENGFGHTNALRQGRPQPQDPSFYGGPLLVRRRRIRGRQ